MIFCKLLMTAAERGINTLRPKIINEVLAACPPVLNHGAAFSKQLDIISHNKHCPNSSFNPTFH